MSTSTRRKKPAGYRPARSLLLISDKHGAKLFRDLNAYAKRNEVSIQDAAISILREVLSSWRSDGKPPVQIIT